MQNLTVIFTDKKATSIMDTFNFSILDDNTISVDVFDNTHSKEIMLNKAGDFAEANMSKFSLTFKDGDYYFNINGKKWDAELSEFC